MTLPPSKELKLVILTPLRSVPHENHQRRLHKKSLPKGGSGTRTESVSHSSADCLDSGWSAILSRISDTHKSVLDLIEILEVELKGRQYAKRDETVISMFIHPGAKVLANLYFRRLEEVRQ